MRYSYMYLQIQVWKFEKYFSMKGTMQIVIYKNELNFYYSDMKTTIYLV